MEFTEFSLLGLNSNFRFVNLSFSSYISCDKVLRDKTSSFCFLILNPWLLDSENKLFALKVLV